VLHISVRDVFIYAFYVAHAGRSITVAWSMWKVGLLPRSTWCYFQQVSSWMHIISYGDGAV
jgi:hypothetical protein